MITDPVFWAVAAFSVLITGISKGGFGGLAILAVPLMALVISPIQAAGIMLPILVVMDWVGVLTYRKSWDRNLLLQVLPGAVLGIGVGYLLADFVSDRAVRIAVGIIAVLFPIYSLAKPQTSGSFIKNNRLLGGLSGLVAGFTSFLAHAGGPPYQAYAIPQELEKRLYAGTAVMFFTVVNAVKLIPYAMLGQLDMTNLTISLWLIPLAPIGVLLGAWLVTRINQDLFYKILYGLVFCVGLKLLWDGLLG